MADSQVAITAGSGTNIDTYAVSGGDHQQVVREARATAAASINTWTPSTTASTSQIAADASRVMLLITNASNVRVYLRFDSTAPTSATHHWYLDAGDRWEVPMQLTTLAVSMLGASTGTGTVNSLLATAS
ncbi:hypothetical protein DEJ49_33470 [Streptomyces venezuelae]|uniref:Uncharacterized protein n=1 Tax=Streptomyces venezuelae TaxID=54571 RepID=A0A5P2CVV8_STRVZ|nr:hypothetical protein [Streptomyces venezuelae]QES45251.1 hypothetical protein DEJ49_33470 [Streptomyces venezuelae]